jgi:hypothetical protein
MLMCLLTHDRSVRRTLLTPLLNGDPAIVEADGEITLTLAPFSYRLIRLRSWNTSQLGDEYDADCAELYAQADFILFANAQPGALTLYRFHESTLQVSGYTSMSESDLADLRRCGVFVRLYEPGAGEGSVQIVVLTFPLGTRVQDLAAEALAEDLVQAGAAHAAITPGPYGCEVHYASGVVPLARLWLPGPLARVFPPLVAAPVDERARTE